MRRIAIAIRFVSLIPILLTSSLAAENEAVTHRVSFFVFSSPKLPVDVFYQKEENKFEEVQLYGANVSPILRILNHEGRIRLHGEPERNAEGQLVYPVIASVKLSAKTTKALVILFADPESDDLRFDGRSIPVTREDFPDGSLKFANLTKHRIRCRLGKAQYGVPPQSFQTLRYKDPEDTVIGVLFQYEDADNNWLRMISTRWRVPAEGRTIMFAYSNPKTGDPSTKSLPLPENFE